MAGFAKISDFFPCDLSKWNLGENFGFVKFKIFEWKLVFPLIFADDFFEIFHSWIFKNFPGGISFSDKLRGIAVNFIFRVSLSGDNFLKMILGDKGKDFAWKQRGMNLEICHFILKWQISRFLSYAKLSVSSMIKRVLGQPNFSPQTNTTQ